MYDVISDIWHLHIEGSSGSHIANSLSRHCHIAWKLKSSTLIEATWCTSPSVACRARSNTSLTWQSRVRRIMGSILSIPLSWISRGCRPHMSEVITHVLFPLRCQDIATLNLYGYVLVTVLWTRYFASESRGMAIFTEKLQQLRSGIR